MDCCLISLGYQSTILFIRAQAVTAFKLKILLKFSAKQMIIPNPELVDFIARFWSDRQSKAVSKQAVQLITISKKDHFITLDSV